MTQISAAAMERTMKVYEVMLRTMSKQITWWQAGCFGCSPFLQGTFRRRTANKKDVVRWIVGSGCQGERRSTFQPLFLSRRYRKRSCRRLSRCCQNSIVSGWRR